LLDPTKVNNSKLFWQMLNVVLPVLAIILMGLLLSFIRRRKYAR